MPFFAYMPKLDVPDWEVLLSDFDDWHHALNYWYLSQDEADDSEFNEWIASLGVDFRDIGNWNLRSSELSQVRAKVESSWERIVGVRQGDDYWHFPWEKRTIQATFWTLSLEHVVSVERFASR